MFEDAPPANRRLVTALLPFWLLGLSWTGFVALANTGLKGPGLHDPGVPDAVAYPLMVFFTLLVLAARDSASPSEASAGVNRAALGLYTLASVPYLLYTPLTFSLSPLMVVAEVCVLAACLSGLMSPRRRFRAA